MVKFISIKRFIVATPTQIFGNNQSFLSTHLPVGKTNEENYGNSHPVIFNCRERVRLARIRIFRNGNTSDAINNFASLKIDRSRYTAIDKLNVPENYDRRPLSSKTCRSI